MYLYGKSSELTHKTDYEEVLSASSSLQYNLTAQPKLLLHSMADTGDVVLLNCYKVESSGWR